MIETSLNRTAFVLAGGGSLGAVQAGMLAELIAAGVRPDLIVGVSAGALNGAFLTYDPSSEMVEHIAGMWRNVSTREALGLSWRSLLGVFGFRGHLADSRGLAAILRRELPYQAFDAARVPLYVVAADETTGDEVVLSNSNVLDAVLASTAIPGVLPAGAGRGAQPRRRRDCQRYSERNHRPSRSHPPYQSCPVALPASPLRFPATRSAAPCTRSPCSERASCVRTTSATQIWCCCASCRPCARSSTPHTTTLGGPR